MYVVIFFFKMQGAKFPWESAVTGCEVCPEEIYGDQEIHINGDVMMAFKQYYEMTKVFDQKSQFRYS